ncbi:PHD finger family protein [Zea mays]|uniref:PHD finger family protein n=2 Tax=Zea mays TaxID=4577 RepID=A0A1D6HLG1_MAIZE|nr:PHD finger family protein [Zea mays]AQK75249.1 PHD finger family protein [Zea mays]AQK75260.1 PHD finger family protein [Zea mays]AQK75268.1 PHD finger family protein [Zea mays]
MSGEMARAEALPEGEAPGFGVDLYAQATKAVSLRTPFEGDEAAPRVPTLPARLVSWAGPGDARKKHKKILPPPPDDAAPEPPPQSPVVTPAKVGLWDQFEAYFRPVTLADVEMLRPKLPFGYSKVDSCMLVPFLGSGNESTTQAETYDVAVAETTLYLGVGGEEVVTNRERGVQSVHLASQKERNDQSIEHDIHDVVVQQMVSDKELNRHRGVQGIHEVSIQLGGRSSGVDQAGSSSGIVLGQFVNEEGTSLNWLLGATGRFVLTSERPNKKRKLLGVDAGLEQLVLLPRVGAEASASCDVCCLGESSMESNRIVNCSNCKVSVHQKCYGLHAVPDGQWLCAWCTYLESTGWSLKEDAGNTQSMPCALCPKEKGALKPVKVESTRNEGIGHQKFVHLYCSLWAPEVFVEDMESMEPVLSLENVQENRMKLTCSICKIKHGACVRCSHGTCRTPFHPICARESKHQMEIWGKSRHPNVELRAFCSKHSAVEYASSVDTSNLASEQNPRKSGPYNTTLNSGKIPVIRFTRKNKDKFISCGTSASSSGNLIRVKTIEQDALANTVRNANSQPIRIWETGTGHPSVSGDHIRSSGDIAVVLRKLIDSGKVSVSDVASEVGISSESLEAALVGETTTFSHGLTLKIIKWLQNSVHMHGAQGNVCKGSSGVVQDNKSDGLDTTDTVDVKNALVLDDDKGVLVDVPDFAVTEPARTRSKSNSKILKENNATCATGVTIVQNGEKNMVKEDSNPECAAKEFANESTQGFSPSSSKDVLKDEHGILILNDTSGNKESGTSTQIPNEKQGALLGRKNNDLTEVELGPCLEKGVPSHGHCFVQGDNGVDGVGSVENSFNTSNCSHGQPFFNFDDSHSYIHPFIKKKVSHHWDITFNQNKETLNHYIQESSYPSHEKIPTDSLVEVESTADTTVTDQVLKARSSKILEHSPDDEVEGEMVYLQSRLLDNAVVLKHRYEKLIAKVVQNLCRELDAFSKRKWDLIFVNQFLRDVREAKKRGRKEKRHKEAQAVLAAAAAAIASSSRNSTVRKDAKENAPESSPKLVAGSSRVGQRTFSLPRINDSSKSSNNKVSSDNKFGSFHMPISSKENGLYCDVCMRTETLLNRIFVCSRCKAAVHIDCYRNLENSIGPWNCELCEDEDISSEATSTTVSDKSHCNGKLPFAQCGMCHGTSGAFRKTVDGKWVHAFCAEWLLDTKYVRGQDSPVEGMENLVEGKDTCCLCLCNVGMCLRCSSGDCNITFHPTCARSSGLYMNTKGFGTTSQHKAYCDKHSVEQKEADAQQYGPEELRSMKRMRVSMSHLPYIVFMCLVA